MPLFELKSLSKEFNLENPSEGRKASKRVDQYRVGDQAIYFPAFPGDQYLPFSAVASALSRNTAISVKGTCGKQLPMVRLRLYYDGGEFYKDFMFEKQKDADKVLDALRAFDPSLPIERDITPFGS
jgi:hypothetical protein